MYFISYILLIFFLHFQVCFACFVLCCNIKIHQRDILGLRSFVFYHDCTALVFSPSAFELLHQLFHNCVNIVSTVERELDQASGIQLQSWSCGLWQVTSLRFFLWKAHQLWRFTVRVGWNGGLHTLKGVTKRVFPCDPSSASRLLTYRVWSWLCLV